MEEFEFDLGKKSGILSLDLADPFCFAKSRLIERFEKMKRNFLVLIVCIILYFGLRNLYADWMIYECNELLLKAEPAWAVHNTNEPNGAQSMNIADNDNSDNNLLFIDDKASAKTCFKMERLDQVRDVIRLKHYSIRTEKGYVS